MSKLVVGDRVFIRPKLTSGSFNNDDLARRLSGRRAWVIKEPWFLAMFDVYHVLLSVDDGELAEIEINWCEKLGALDLLAEIQNPPPPPLPLPPKRPPPSQWRRFLRWLFGPHF